MPRKIQPTYTASNQRHTIACLGDSITYNTTLGVIASEFWPYQVQKALRALGATVQVRNFGKSGDTTAQMVARVACLTQYEVPTVVALSGGINDSTYDSTVQASPAPTTTSFSVAAAKGLGYAVGAKILVNGVSATVLTVATDAIVVTASLGFTPTAGQTVTIDTQKNLELLGTTAGAAGCSRLVVVDRHYDNFSAGGDTTATPLASGVTLRAKQQAAATTLGAAYCDVYTTMRNLIVAGTVTQGSFSWHVLDSNIHLNAAGELILAGAVVSTIQAQSGWVTALT